EGLKPSQVWSGMIHHQYPPRDHLLMHLTTPLATLKAEGSTAMRREARNHACYMPLNALPVSPAASALVSSIVNDVIGPFQAARGQLRPSMVAKVHQATGPFLADLLRAGQQGRWASLATRNADLMTYPGGKTAFGTMRAAMVADGLLEEMSGFKAKPG